MKEKTEIKQIILKVGGKEISLSLEEAKELMGLLNGTFGKQETVYIPQPYDRYIPYDSPPYIYPRWVVTWGSTGVITYTSNSNQ